MKKQLMVSLMASFEGINPVKYWPCDPYVRHMIPLPEHGLNYTDKELYESEYDSGVWDRFKIAPENEAERIEAEDALGDEFRGWDELREIQVEGIVTFHQAMRYLDHIGATFEDCPTMGTLGGPLGIGIVPDIPFTVESALVISSIRITPFWGSDCACEPLTEASWERVLDLFREFDAYKLARMGVTA